MADDANDQPSGSLVGDLTGIGKVIDSEIATRIYDEVLSPAMKQVGLLSEDFVKSIHLIAAPFQLLAVGQDRLRHFCDRIREKVPEDRQRQAPPEIAKPVIEAVMSTSDESPLMSMFEELMAKAIDVDEADKLSPEFPAIIKSLSPLQAKLITSLAQRESHSTVAIVQNDQRLIIQYLTASFEPAEYGGLNHHLTLVQNLEEKKLLLSPLSHPKASEFPDVEVPDGCHIERTTYRLSMFGRWFASSCTRS